MVTLHPMQVSRRRWMGVALALTAFCLDAPADAREHTGSQSAAELATAGRPRIVIDRIEVPESAPAFVQRHLREVLRREARKADWGAGRGSTISVRYTLRSLGIKRDGDVVRVRCSAIGRLPRNKSASGQLSYGGDPAKQSEVVKRALEIVARGVITRLAELERNRRAAGAE
jgi:hypothetical protein